MICKHKIPGHVYNLSVSVYISVSYLPPEIPKSLTYAAIVSMDFISQIRIFQESDQALRFVVCYVLFRRVQFWMVNLFWRLNTLAFFPLFGSVCWHDILCGWLYYIGLLHILRAKSGDVAKPLSELSHRRPKRKRTLMQNSKLSQICLDSHICRMFSVLSYTGENKYSCLLFCCLTTHRKVVLHRWKSNGMFGFSTNLPVVTKSICSMSVTDITSSTKQISTESGKGFQEISNLVITMTWSTHEGWK